MELSDPSRSIVSLNNNQAFRKLKGILLFTRGIKPSTLSRGVHFPTN
jgi:hypothetical protein